MKINCGIKCFTSFAILALTACSYYQQYCENRKQTVKCFEHCEQRCLRCQHVCGDDEKTCRAKANAIAAVHFEQYQRQQKLKGQPVVAELAAFRDPLACHKITCDCAQDKEMCYQACQGTISKRLRPTIQLN